MLTVEYGLLARGEDPRLAAEAERITDAFAARWGLEFAEEPSSEEPTEKTEGK